MGSINITGAVLTPLRIVHGAQGNVLHALRADETSFRGFGEAYFSTVAGHAVKPWKRHRRMTLNLVVPIGKIRFVLWDERKGSATEGRTEAVVLSKENYQRLTVPPGVWLAFQGLEDSVNLLLNVADLPHDPEEIERCSLDRMPFDWSAT